MSMAVPVANGARPRLSITKGRRTVALRVTRLRRSVLIEIRRCTMDDYNAITAAMDEFWDDDRTLPLHHALLVHEFGDTAFVAAERDRVMAYLFGFLSQINAAGYVHLVAVRDGHRRRGLARKLYGRFAEVASARACQELKAIVIPENTASLAFHSALGFAGGVVPNYSGPGKDRFVLHKPL